MNRHSTLLLSLSLLVATCTGAFGAAVTSPSPVSNLMDFQGGVTVEGTRPASAAAGQVAIGGGTIAASGDGYFKGYLYFNTNAGTNASGCSFGIAGEGQSRLSIFNSGALLWGPGTAAFDTSLSRGSAGFLTTGGSFAALGKLGVGTTSTVSQLSVQDTAYPSTFGGLASTVTIGNGIQNGQFAKLTFGNNAGGNYGGIGLQVSGNGSYLYLGTSNNYATGITNSAVVIDPNGNVGIGTTPSTSALAVNGVISAKEVLVVANPADYVFAAGYRLRPLAEVEAFITAHQHLPGVPSAKEQEEQGELVADLMRAHLEKIEEQALYIIALDKQRREDQVTLATSNQRVAALEQSVAKLLDRLDRLERAGK